MILTYSCYGDFGLAFELRLSHDHCVHHHWLGDPIDSTDQADQADQPDQSDRGDCRLSCKLLSQC
jgi:hypothetical protein